MPQTKVVEKPLTTREQILGLVNAIADMHDRNLLSLKRGHGAAMEALTHSCLAGRPTRVSSSAAVSQDKAVQGAYSVSVASPTRDRSLAEAVEGLLTGCRMFSHVWTRETERAGGATLGEEFPPLAPPPDPKAGHL